MTTIDLDIRRDLWDSIMSTMVSMGVLSSTARRGHVILTDFKKGSSERQILYRDTMEQLVSMWRIVE